MTEPTRLVPILSPGRATADQIELMFLHAAEHGRPTEFD
jgi:hypothetical protein